MAEPTEVILEKSVFQILEELRDQGKTVAESLSEEGREEYKNNLIHEDETVNIVPAKFDNKFFKDYSLIGEAIFTGGMKVLFEEYKKFKKAEEYSKGPKKSPKEKSLAAKLNVNNQEQKEKGAGPNWIKTLMTGLLLAFAALGIAGGTGILGQGIESIGVLSRSFKNIIKNISKSFKNSKLGKFLKSFKNKSLKIISKVKKFKNFLSSGVSKIGNLFGKSSKFFKTLSKLSGGVSKFFSWAGELGSSVTKSIGSISKLGSSFTKLLGTGALKLGASVGKYLKFLPLIGTALGFYQTYLRFEKGEYMQGAIELAATLAGLVPGVGTAISIGLNVLNSLIDSGAGTGGGLVSGTMKVVGKMTGAVKSVGSSIGKLLSKAFKSILKPLATGFKKIPFVGFIVSFGFAYSDFKSGNYLSGTLNILSGLAGLLDFVAPGVGTAISLGIDALNFFLTSDSESMVAARETSASWLTNAWDWIVEKVGAAMCFISNWVTEKWSALVDGFNESNERIKEKLGEWYGKASETVGEWYGALKGNLAKAGGWLQDKVTNFKDKLQGMFDSAKGFLKEHLSPETIDKFRTIRDKIVSKYEEIKKNLKDTVNNISNKVSAVVDSIFAFISKLKNEIFTWVEEKYTSITGKINQWATDAGKAIGDTWDSMWGNKKQEEIVKDQRNVTQNNLVNAQKQNVENFKISNKNFEKLSTNTNGLVSKTEQTNQLLEKLCTITENKPVAFADARTTVMYNGNNANVGNITGNEPRNKYINN